MDRRFQSTLLIPLNARLAIATATELDEELEKLTQEGEDLEDDTL